MTARRKPLIPTAAELATMEWPQAVVFRKPVDAAGLEIAIGPLLQMTSKVHFVAVRGDDETLICTVQYRVKGGGFRIGRPDKQRAFVAPTVEKALAVMAAAMPAAFAKL